MTENVKAPLATRPEILLIEDDPQIRKFLTVMLTAEEYRVFDAASGASGMAQAATRIPDLVLLGLGLPDRDGLEIIRDIRGWSQMPIIVISARDQERDKIDALDAGADDYVTKPFTPGEVSARIRAILRRATVLDRNEAAEIVNFGAVSVNLGARRVTVSGTELHLTPNEYKLLVVLLKHRGTVITQRQLLKEVWGPEHVEDREYLRVFMSQLRHKIEGDPAHPKFLITEPGIGYRLLTEEL